jgi:hypothetical protein
LKQKLERYNGQRNWWTGQKGSMKRPGYPVHTRQEFQYYVWGRHPYTILCIVPANCKSSGMFFI